MISLKTLQTRADMLAAIRAFFAHRNVLEVDTPILSRSAPVATHMDVMTIHFANGERGYLHTSTEYAMKRLLAEHPVDMYQLCHVFREGESSDRHNPEFTMIEWYRMRFSLKDLIDETIEIIELFIGSQKPTFLTYRDLFLHYCNFDPFQVTLEKFPNTHPTWSVDTWLDYIMSFEIQPRMKGLIVLQGFPPSQAALAQLKQEGAHLVAERYEIYYNGLELANGFHELTDPVEQRLRFENDIKERAALGKPSLPIDDSFLQALEKGLPDCCGVAVGFDRLLMLQQNASSLKDVVPFIWN
ncbi:MAG: EF-P lysine aminoacylase EpmA [Rhabdochlamydiaceae bacterium]